MLVSMWVKGQAILDDTLIQPSYEFYQHLPHTNNAFECILIGILASIFLFKNQIVGFFLKTSSPFMFAMPIVQLAVFFHLPMCHVFVHTLNLCTLNLPIYYIYP